MKKLKLNLIRDGNHQVQLQDSSEVSAGVSRVTLDFVTPYKKRIELNGLTETKAFNFVNQFINAFFTVTDTDLGQTVINPCICEVDYSIHYPYREELLVTVGDNLLPGRDMLNLLSDADWLYINEEYYQVIRNYSTQDYLFLDRPMERDATTCEIAYRDKVYLPLVEGIRRLISWRFRNLTGNKASIPDLEDLQLATMMILGLVDNIDHGDVKNATLQLAEIKRLLQWEKQSLDFLLD